MSGSGLRQTVTVTLDDGTVLKTETSLADTLRWEKVNKRGWFDQDKTSMSQIAFIAWSSLQRGGQFGDSYDVFSGRIADLDLATDEASPGPTDTAPGDG